MPDCLQESGDCNRRASSRNLLAILLIIEWSKLAGKCELVLASYLLQDGRAGVFNGGPS